MKKKDFFALELTDVVSIMLINAKITTKCQLFGAF